MQVTMFDRTVRRISVCVISTLCLFFILLLTSLVTTAKGDPSINAIQLTFDDFDQYAPTFSSDSSKIIYSCKTIEVVDEIAYTRYSVWTMDADGSNQTKVADGTEAVFCLNDSHIVYGGYGDLMIMNLTTREQRNISKEDYIGLGFPSVSPDGDIVACKGMRVDPADGSILLVNLTSLRIEREIYRGGFYWYCPPAFYPDSSKIAFHDTSIRVVDIHTGNYTTMYNIPDGIRELKISPDGKEILYEVDWAGIPSEIWAMSIDGNNRTFITNGIDPSYSPDGTKIVYSADEDGDGNYDIWIMDNVTLSQNEANGTIDYLPYYITILVVVVAIAITVIFLKYKKRPIKDENEVVLVQNNESRDRT